MNKYLLLLLLTCACSLLAAQDTFSLAEVDSPPTLNHEDIAGTKATDSQDKLFLSSIYSQIRYPREARENGIMTAIKASWLINAKGEVVVEDVDVLSEKEALNTAQSKNNIVVTGYSSAGPSKGTTVYRIDHADMTKRQIRQQRKLNVLVEEVRSVLGKLPRFEPGIKAGTPVATRYENLFLFRLE